MKLVASRRKSISIPGSFLAAITATALVVFGFPTVVSAVECDTIGQAQCEAPSTDVPTREVETATTSAAANEAPTITPVVNTNLIGTLYNYTFSVTGSPAPTLSWQVSNDKQRTWKPYDLTIDADFATVNKSTISIKSFATPGKPKSFRLVATNTLGSTFSAPIKVPEIEIDNRCINNYSTYVFNDVAASYKFAKEISWLYCMGYTTGVRSDGKLYYKPQDNLSREAMAAFLFRIAAPDSYEAPSVSHFSDVHPGDKFYREISWMWDQHISTGIAQPAGKPRFDPHAGLSREAMAAFLYRFDQPPGVIARQRSPFADVPTNAQFYKQISWMLDAGITTGVRDGNTKKFLPKSLVTREAMAAFIFRLRSQPAH